MGMHDYAGAGPILQGLASTVDLRKPNQAEQQVGPNRPTKSDSSTNVWFTVAEGYVVDVGAKK